MKGKKENIKGVEIKIKCILEIGRFSILWNMFENKKCEYNCNSRKLTEIVSELETLNKKPFEKFAAKLKDRAYMLDYNINEYVSESLYPNENARVSQNDIKKNVPLVEAFIESNGQHSLEGGLLAIYRIRNNMFHGLKNYNGLNDQIELFKAINDVLEVII